MSHSERRDLVSEANEIIPLPPPLKDPGPTPKFGERLFREFGHLAMKNSNRGILSEEPADALMWTTRECAWPLA